jgi:hypothetical protein
MGVQIVFAKGRGWYVAESTGKATRYLHADGIWRNSGKVYFPTEEEAGYVFSISLGAAA